MISLKNIRDRVGQVEGYIKTTDANNYIANQGTVSSTNNLAGLPLTHYNCNGSCSWACSGSCSKGAGGGGRDKCESSYASHPYYANLYQVFGV